MKRTINAMLATTLISSASLAHAQLAVFDGVAAGNWVQQIAAAREQLSELRNQYSQAKQAYDAISGARDIGNILRNQLLDQYMPSEYAPVLAAIRAGTDGNIPGLANQIKDVIQREQRVTCAAQFPDQPQARANCDATWRQYAGVKVIQEQHYKRASTNLKSMEQMLDKLVTNPDPKAAQDYNSRLSLENLKLQNTQIQLATMKQMQEEQEKMRQQAVTDQERQSFRDEIGRLQSNTKRSTTK
jgi:type IV secretion system protein VirB5